MALSSTRRNRREWSLAATDYAELLTHSLADVGSRSRAPISRARQMTAFGVRRAKAALSSGCKPHPANRGVREDVGEASVGERIGQPLSREIVINPGADVVHLTEGKIAGRVIASARRARRGLRPWHVRTLLVREPGDLWIGHRPCWGRMVRSGKVRSRSR